MEDLNCPSCGTTQQKIIPGFCECCGFEFTEEYINDFISRQKKQEEKIRKKVEEEERKKRAIRERIEKERLERKKREEKAQLERERLRAILQKDNERIERETKFSKAFLSFGRGVSLTGIIGVIIVFVISVFISVTNNKVTPVNLAKQLELKAKSFYCGITVPTHFDDNAALFVIDEKQSNDTARMTIGTIKLFNSISNMVQDSSSIGKKVEFLFPSICEEVASSSNGFFEKDDSKYFVDNAEIFNDDEKDKLIERLSSFRTENEIDFVIVSTKSFRGKSAEAFSKDFFRNKNYGYGETKCGCILTFNSETGECSFVAIRADFLENADIDLLMSKCSKLLKQKKYFKVSTFFINQIQKISQVNKAD